MVDKTFKMPMEENAAKENVNPIQVEKMSATSLQEATFKRAVLGNLQNNGPNNKLAIKEAAPIELKVLKLTNPVRNANPRVGSNMLTLTSRDQNTTNAVASGSFLLQYRSLGSQIPITSSKIKVGESIFPSQTDNRFTGLANPATGLDENVANKKESGASSSMTLVRVHKPQIGSNLATHSSTTTTSKLLAGIKDIDAGDKENIFLAAEYVNEIYDHLYKLEQEQPIQPDHLNGQVEVSHGMRSVLINWINDVHLQFRLVSETFQMAVAIIDRYLQVVKNTKRNDLQLVGVTSLFIATKYEELMPASINDFVYITDNAYTAKELQMMELKVLKAIDYNLSRPLPLHFLRRYSKAAGAENEHHVMSKYFVELSMVEYKLASYRPSEIAAASLFLSLNLLDRNFKSEVGLNNECWNVTLAHYSRYAATHLVPIARRIAKLAHSAPQAKLRSVYQKYNLSNFQKIAQRPELTGPLMDSIIANRY